MRNPVFSSLPLVALYATLASAHCDRLDGPVVHAARRALSAGDVNLVMPWVQPAGEAEVRQAFARALEVRKLSPEAGKLADTWFFETVVRIHRAGEGAPYEGLKPAGRDLGPAIPAADHAVESGRLDALEKLLIHGAAEQLRARFEKARAGRAYDPRDL